MNSIVVSTSDLGQGITINQLVSEDGSIYYRTCRGGVCRYCEDEYVSRMYAVHMGYDPLNTATERTA